MLSAVLLTAGLQPEALVPVTNKLTPEDIARAKALIQRSDPRGQSANELLSLEVSGRDLALLLDYGAGRFVPIGSEVDLRRGGASIALTAQVPENPFGSFFNLRLDLSQAGDGISVEGLQVGSLQVPGMVAEGIGWLIHRALERDDIYRALLASVDDYRVTEDRLVVVYRWRPTLLDKVKSEGRALLIEATDRERLLAYSARIAAVSQKAPRGRKMPLPDLLGPVFEEARDRTGNRGDAAAENRAAIVAMLLHVQGVDVARFLDEPAAARARGRDRTLTLQGRADLAQHFLISAGIAAAGGSRLADAVGLFKELEDSRGGSGFSFTDLAADRAGVRFAETATGPHAARVQRLLAGAADESLFMPVVSGLPEFLPEAELLRRFGGVDTPRYRRIAEDIERRIAALEIHRGR